MKNVVTRWHIIQDRATRELFVYSGVDPLGEKYPYPDYAVISRWMGEFESKVWDTLPWGRGFGENFSHILLGPPK